MKNTESLKIENNLHHEIANLEDLIDFNESEIAEAKANGETERVNQMAAWLPLMKADLAKYEAELTELIIKRRAQ